MVANQLTFKQGDGPQLPWWVQCTHKAPLNVEEGGKGVRTREMTLRESLNDGPLLALKMEGGQELSNAGGF